jgi:hypothetical protein
MRPHCEQNLKNPRWDENVKNSSNVIVPLEVVPVPFHRVKYKNAENLFEID